MASYVICIIKYSKNKLNKKISKVEKSHGSPCDLHNTIFKKKKKDFFLKFKDQINPYVILCA